MWQCGAVSLHQPNAEWWAQTREEDDFVFDTDIECPQSWAWGLKNRLIIIIIDYNQSINLARSSPKQL